jgi:hypothetical protein
MNTRRTRFAAAVFAGALLATVMTALAPLASAVAQVHATPTGKSQCGSSRSRHRHNYQAG